MEKRLNLPRDEQIKCEKYVVVLHYGQTEILRHLATLGVFMITGTKYQFGLVLESFIF